MLKDTSIESTTPRLLNPLNGTVGIVARASCHKMLYSDKRCATNVQQHRLRLRINCEVFTCMNNHFSLHTNNKIAPETNETLRLRSLPVFTTKRTIVFVDPRPWNRKCSKTIKHVRHRYRDSIVPNFSSLRNTAGFLLLQAETILCILKNVALCIPFS